MLKGFVFGYGWSIVCILTPVNILVFFFRDLECCRFLNFILLVLHHRHRKVTERRLIGLWLDCAHWKSPEWTGPIESRIYFCWNGFILCFLLIHDCWRLWWIGINFYNFLRHTEPARKPRRLGIREGRSLLNFEIAWLLMLLGYKKHFVALALHRFVHEMQKWLLENRVKLLDDILSLIGGEVFQ